MDVKQWKKEWHTLPNLLSIFRLILLPLYLYLVYTATDTTNFYWAGVVIALSGVSDFLDGYIARKYQQVTELGKVLDPAADKITQFALIVSMAYHRPEIWLLLLLFLIKESFMVIAGAIGLKKGIKLDGAKWYGKLATAIIYLGMVILLLFPLMSKNGAHFIFIVITFCLALSFLLYIGEYYKMFQHEKNK